MANTDDGAPPKGSQPARGKPDGPRPAAGGDGEARPAHNRPAPSPHQSPRQPAAPASPPAPTTTGPSISSQSTTARGPENKAGPASPGGDGGRNEKGRDGGPNEKGGPRPAPKAPPPKDENIDKSRDNPPEKTGGKSGGESGGKSEGGPAAEKARKKRGAKKNRKKRARIAPPPSAKLNADGHCRNCGEALSGDYCWNCGQAASEPRRLVIGLVQDFFVETLSIDGKLIRTLSLLLTRPGRLARRYLDGQRVRFSPPFRLYLFTSVFFFLALFLAIGDIRTEDEDFVDGRDAVRLTDEGIT
ncbi:MAG: DUF3667 domain-containing protein, partial [Pseudomonadota bacterium]